MLRATAGLVLVRTLGRAAFGAAAVTLAAACASVAPVDDTDPRVPFALDAVTEVDGLAYAGAQFYPEHDRTNFRRGIVVVDIARVLLDRENIANARYPTPDAPPNVAVWDVGDAHLVGASGGHLLAVAAEHGSSDAARLQSYDLSDPWAPQLIGEIALPDAPPVAPSTVVELAPGTFLLSLHHAPSAPPAWRTYIVDVRDGQPRVLSRTDGVGCTAAAITGDHLVCAGSDADAPGDNLLIFRANTEAGIGERVVAGRTEELLAPRHATVRPSGDVIFVDQGRGPQPPRLVTIRLAPHGAVMAVAASALPSLEGHPIAARTVTHTLHDLLVGTDSGGLLVSSSGALTHRDDGLSRVTTVLARPIFGDRYLAVGWHAGLSLLRVGPGTIEREATYFRRWGDPYPSLGNVYEGVY